MLYVDDSLLRGTGSVHLLTYAAVIQSDLRIFGFVHPVSPIYCRDNTTTAKYHHTTTSDHRISPQSREIIAEVAAALRCLV